MLDENAEFAPVTPYGRSKVLAERDISHARGRHLQSDLSAQRDRLRRLAAAACRHRRQQPGRICAVTTGEVLIQSDGTPWRPLVHIEDISRAFLAVLARSARARPQPGVQRRRQQPRTTASARSRRSSQKVVPGARASFAEGGGPDKRSYQVDCSKIAASAAGVQPQWTVRARRRGAPRRPTLRHGLDLRGVHRRAVSADQAGAGAAGGGPARRRAALRLRRPLSEPGR